MWSYARACDAARKITVYCQACRRQGVGGGGSSRRPMGSGRTGQGCRRALCCDHACVYARGGAVRSDVTCLEAITATAAQETHTCSAPCTRACCVLGPRQRQLWWRQRLRWQRRRWGYPMVITAPPWRVLAGTLGFPARARGAAAWESAGGASFEGHPAWDP